MDANSISRVSSRFFYGSVERVLDKGGKGFEFCLVDIREGLFAWYNYPTHLRRAIEALILPVGGEIEENVYFQLPIKHATAEIACDDFEDVLFEYDALAERGREFDGYSFFDPQMLKKDHLRNFPAIEDAHLFSEHLEEERWFLKKVRRSKRVRRSPKAQAAFLSRELNRQQSSAYQDVFEMRNFDELESYGFSYGPFFQESDFTNDLNCLPESIRSQYKFLDMENLLEISQANMTVAKVFCDEITFAFHPELEKAKRKAKNWTWMSNTESPDGDVAFAESPSQKDVFRK
jgi:hypothetical protein